MAELPSYRPASTFSLDALSTIITAAFAGYFYPTIVTPALLAQRIRAEQLDLQHSLVLWHADAPAGIAMLGLRGQQAWCGGFGITAPLRGQQLAGGLATAMIEQARLAGAQALRLEVLVRNTPALRVYLRAGFQPRRDLLVLQWRRAAGAAAPEPTSGPVVVECDPRSLLAHFDRLHTAPAAWQRDLPALLVGANLAGLAILAADQPVAYLLYHTNSAGKHQVADLAAGHADLAQALLGALQQRSEQIFSVNEPADSPVTDAYRAAGFSEADRQHELWLELER